MDIGNVLAVNFLRRHGVDIACHRPGTGFGLRPGNIAIVVATVARNEAAVGPILGQGEHAGVTGVGVVAPDSDKGGGGGRTAKQ